MITMLIADDDQISREGIRRYLLGHFQELSEIWTAMDGEEAFSRFEQHRPDILLTDIIMPKCDGLELLDRLHQSGYSPKTIIISAHENFSYAQNAMHLGVAEYLIKPVLPEQVSSLVAKLIGSLKQNMMMLEHLADLRDKHRHNLPVLRERFFHALVNQPFDGQRMTEKARMVDIDLSGKAYTVAVVRVMADDPAGRAFAERMSEGLPALLTSVFSPELKVYDIAVNSTDTALIAISGLADARVLFRDMNNALDLLLDGTRLYEGITVQCGLGRQYDGVEGIRTSYREALRALASMEIRAENAICNYEDIASCAGPAIKLDGEVEARLLQGVKYWSYAQCLPLIHQIEDRLSGFRESHFQYIRTYFLQLEVTMWRDLQNTNGPEIDFTRLLTLETYEECAECFRQYVADIIGAYGRANEQKGNSLVTQTKQIMRDQMSDSKLSINDVAAKLYVSSGYLRQIFRRQSEESFVEHLTRIRMERALELLRTTQMKIREVSERTGFANQRYFAVCFKKYYNKTPTEVRESPMAED